MSDKDRQERLVRILDGALDLPCARRGTFVAKACEGDHELMVEVVDLLFRAGEVHEFLGVAQEVVARLPSTATAAGTGSGPPVSGDPSGATSHAGNGGKPALAVPESVGPYKILEILGEGGMGVVCLAEQREPVRRRVALKLIKLGMDTREVVARFETERQALAMMDHPSIARVYDAGATSDGRPYFVMEHVRGVPLDEYCDRHRLTVRQRLGLFTQVCQGIDHAHRRGVIHRDLKPSNVLVSTPDQAPVAKIIDFGVARATNQRLTEKTLYTEIGRAVGTPAYMSPEQAEMTGEDVDHRTDVYSLGVTLYELLVGEPPMDPGILAKTAFDEILRRIREDDPPTPSTRWTRMNLETTQRLAAHRNSSPGEFVGILRGDLDWITMKAVEKERERRYGTVAELAADVSRHLEGDPVEAGPPSALYRLKKYVSKNRSPVVLAGAVFMALAVGFVVSLFFALAARQSEKVALRNERLAKQRAAENLVFADIELLRAYDTEEARELRPWPPDKRPQVTAWLEKVDRLLGRLDDYRVELARLRSTAVSRESDPGGGPRTYHFADVDTAQRYEMVQMLVRDLDALGDPDPNRGTVALLRRRLESWPLKDAIEASWKTAIASVRNREECPSYDGLEIEVISDLFPLGRAPRSKLWEFVHLLTGCVPERDDSGALRVIGDMGIVLVLLPGGEFDMGSPPDEKGRPRPGEKGPTRTDREDWEMLHTVSLSSFLIAKHEVTQSQWKAVMGQIPSRFDGDTLPVERVSWDACREFCKKTALSLPTEAQWEYACRAGTSTPFSFGATITPEEVNYNGTAPYGDTPTGLYRERTVPVGSLPANDFGLHEMHGNVGEWCADGFDPSFYRKSRPVDPLRTPSRGPLRSIRGSSWRDEASQCRSAYRFGRKADTSKGVLGFRPARSVP